MTAVLIRGNFRHRHRKTTTTTKHCEAKKTQGEGYEKVETEMGIRLPQAENHRGPPEARRGREEFFL